MATTINTTENTVSVTSAEHDITVTNNNTGTSVNVNSNQATSVTVGATGPIGPRGEPGATAATILAANVVQPFNHVTASGNISASGTITASNLSGTNTGDQTDITGNAGTADQVDTIKSEANSEHYVTFVDSNNTTATPETINTNDFLQVNPAKRLVSIQGKLLVKGSSITFESGSISASNNIFASGNITASGNISSSGTIVASSFTGDGSGLTGVTSYTDSDTQDFIDSINVISGSAQIATEISGAFIATSASLASDIATNLSRNNGNTDNIGTNTTKITSLTAATSSYALKSKISGSLGPNGTLIRSLTATSISESFVAPSASFSTRVTANDAKVGYTDSLVKAKLNTEGVISSSAQIASNISGSFVEASASFSTRVTDNDAKIGYTDSLVKAKLNTDGVLSGSAQVSLSGFDTDDLSEGSSNLYYTDARVKTKLNTDGVVSSSAQIASDISGSLGANATLIRSLTRTSISESFVEPSSSFSTRVTTLETDNTGDQDLSSYALIAKISGSFVAPSSSFSTRVTTIEGNVGQAVNTNSDVTFATISATSLTVTSITSSIVTSSILQTEGSNIFGDASNDTHTFNGNITASGNISASGYITTGGYISASQLVTTKISHVANGDDKITFENNFINFVGGSGVGQKTYFRIDDVADKVYVNHAGEDIDFQVNTDNSIAIKVDAGDDIVYVGNTYDDHFPLSRFHSTAEQNRFTSTVNIINYGWDSSLNETFPEFAKQSGSLLRVFGHTPTTSHNLVSASIHVSSSIGTTFIDDGNISLSGNITASGNISASGIISGSNLSGTNTGDQDLSTYALISSISGSLGPNAALIRSLTATSISESFVAPSASFSTRVSTLETNNTGTNTGDQDLSNLAVTSSNVLFGHITASGDISASANVYANRYYVDGKLAIDYAGTSITYGQNNQQIILRGSTILFGADNTQHVTASGNISASGDLTANNITGVTSIDSTLYKIDGHNAIDFAVDTFLFGNTSKFTKLRSTRGIEMTSPVTASSHISASGGITAHSFTGPLTGTATSASRADTSNKVYTSQDNSDEEHFVTFVDSNNVTHADEDVHTTNFLRVNPLRRELIVEGRISVPGSSITFESGSISASKDIFAPTITASGTISSSGDIHSATIRYVANIHDANNDAMISGTSTNLSLGDVSNGSNRTKITINDSSRQIAFSSDEPSETTYQMPGIVTTNMVRTKNLRGQSPLIIDPTSVIISASQQFALGVGGTTSSLFLTSSITSSAGKPRIGFNTREPQTDFDVSAKEVQFQRPGERKGLKINDEGNIESFDKSAASATTGSEFILNYSRGVTINAQSMVAAGFGPFGAGEGGDSQALTLFNNFTADKQNAILEILEAEGFISPPQTGDTIGSIRFIAQSGSSEDFDARSTGETAAIKAVVSDGGATGIASDLIFSVAGKEGGATQKMLLDANGQHEMTGSLSLDSIKINGVLQSRTNLNSTIGFAALSSDQDIEFKPNGTNMLTLAPDLINFNSGYANADFRVNGNSGAQAALGNIFIFGDASQDSGKGYLGVGTGSPTERLHVVGNIKVDGNIVPASDDTSTLGTPTKRWNDVFAVSTTTGGVFEVGLRTEGIGKLETGTIVSWKDGKCIPCCKSEDNMVMGVIKQGKDEPIVLGAEPVLVTGKVEEGDYIITSEVVGHGKAAKEGYIFKKNLFGKVIAQALESAEGDSSLIKCMIRKM